MNPLYTTEKRVAWLGCLPGIDEALNSLRIPYDEGRTIYSAGCGGSFAQALHFTGELISGMNRRDGRSVHAVTLGLELSALTAWSNDEHWETAYSRQLRGADSLDTLVCFTTSGKSKSLVLAAHYAQSIGMDVVVITGPNPGPIDQYADAIIRVPGERTAIIQEHTLVVLHHLAGLLETPRPF